MTPERYRQIGEIYHAVLEVDREKRGAFLDLSCAGDEALRREVESLVASHEQASDFIATPALMVAAGMISRRHSLVGQNIANFHVLSLIGEGGMGEVYLAEDIRLGRRVALKLLSSAFTSDEDRMRRFVQEARAASALNHPNILTVHEIGRANGYDFIATEFIEGETLRSTMVQGNVPLTKVLDIAAQVAGALAAAHAAGVVHRDVKPENIMLRPDGYVKVLDFGLAKLAGEGVYKGNEAATIARVETNPGVVMGTVQYMSPEQTRGRPIDARTDTWSLGVVLYEMIAHRAPFEGETQSDTIVSILERKPKPLTVHAPEAPVELERIVTKALAKDKDERYQTANDMAIDLRRLRRRLQVESEIEWSAQSTSKSEESAALSYNGQQSASARTDSHAATQASYPEAVRTTSSLEYVVGEIKRHKRGATLVGATLVLLFGGIGYGFYKLFRVPKPVTPFQKTKMTRLTATGKAKVASFSPDGKYLVYAEEDADQQALWVKQVATGSSVLIVPPAEVGYWGLTFSNDSNYVYYVRYEKGSSITFNKLYQVPSLGGASKKLMERVDSAITFSPDGRRFAFVRDNLRKEETEVVLANADGSGEQTLSTRRAPARFESDVATRIAWSPNGEIIACPARNSDAEGYYFNVVGVSVADGSEQPLTSRRWKFVGQVAWLSEGGLVMTAADETYRQLWHLSYPGDEAYRITNDLNRYGDVTLTADSKSLVTVQKNRESNIWVGPREDMRRARQITSGTLDGDRGLGWTPDGRIVYQSIASGNPHLWIMDADGSNRKQLTHEGQENARPTVSTDRRHIFFSSLRSGKTNVWRMDLDGANEQQLTYGKINAHGHPSPDGRWVAYVSMDQGNATIWRTPTGGGQPERVSDPTANLPLISPDGKQIACYYWDEQADPPRGVMVFPSDGGTPTRRFKIPIGGFVLRWSADGRAILYIGERLTNIWSQPLAGGDPVKVTDVQGDQIFNFDYSLDGQWLALARGRVTDDVVLIEDLR